MNLALSILVVCSFLFLFYKQCEKIVTTDERDCIRPKFKVGDKVRSLGSKKEFMISEVVIKTKEKKPNEFKIEYSSIRGLDRVCEENLERA